jgi:hypothetical protein
MARRAPRAPRAPTGATANPLTSTFSVETMGFELLRAGCLPVSGNPVRGSFVQVRRLLAVIASGSRPAHDLAFVTPL